MLDLTSPYREHLAALVAGYRRVLADHQLDAVVLASGQAAARSRFDDQHWPIALTPAFAHWLPLPEADAFLMLVLASIAADLASLGWNPLATVVDALLSPYSPLAIFRARWMLIDV